MYTIQFDFDAWDDPPKVMICESSGTAIMEIYEDPRLLRDVWSNDDDAWEPGPLAQRVLAWLNKYGEEG